MLTKTQYEKLKSLNYDIKDFSIESLFELLPSKVKLHRQSCYRSLTFCKCFNKYKWNIGYSYDVFMVCGNNLADVLISILEELKYSFKYNIIK